MRSPPSTLVEWTEQGLCLPPTLEMGTVTGVLFADFLQQPSRDGGLKGSVSELVALVPGVGLHPVTVWCKERVPQPDTLLLPLAYDFSPTSFSIVSPRILSRRFPEGKFNIQVGAYVCVYSISCTWEVMKSRFSPQGPVIVLWRMHTWTSATRDPHTSHCTGSVTFVAPPQLITPGWSLQVAK